MTDDKSGRNNETSLYKDIKHWKGENSGYYHFLFASECLEKSFSFRLNGLSFVKDHSFSSNSIFIGPWGKRLVKALLAEDEAGDEHFLLFLQCFLPYRVLIPMIWFTFLQLSVTLTLILLFATKDWFCGGCSRRPASTYVQFDLTLGPVWPSGKVFDS